MTKATVSDQTIKIIVPPVMEESHFLHKVTLPVGIENKSQSDSVLVEKITLAFRSDSGKASPLTTITQSISGFQIKPLRLDYVNVSFTPNLHFLKGTNQFDVCATIQWEHEHELGRAIAVNGPTPWIVIHEAAKMFGKVFISYKEPEDRQLADLLLDFCSKAGFDPYIAPGDMQPGSKIWEEKIPPKIKGSDSIFVIWTANSPKGEGVRKEIGIARKAAIHEVPLIDAAVKVPPEYDGKGIEYTTFERRQPALVFARAVTARRDMAR